MPKEYIERDVVLSHKWEVRSYDPSDPDPVTEVVSVSSIMRIPAADVVEVRHGSFLGTEFDGYADGNPVYYEWQCSVCGCIFEDEEPTYNYCPYCGARMDGGQDDV